jgi:hypothetical protein
MNKSFFKILKRIWILGGIGFTGWLIYSMQAHGVEPAYFQSSSRVDVEEEDDFISFATKQKSPNILIFFPGALVDVDAYVPLCYQLAENGIKTYLIKMPWRQAKLGYNKVKDLQILADTSLTYILAGHSQGAKMAAQFVYENPGLIDKAVLLATTHPRDIDLSKSSTRFMKIYGSCDGVAKEKDIEVNKIKLPESTFYKRIEGANHSQFGYYGFQLGDESATISREKQHQMALSSILQFTNEP